MPLPPGLTLNRNTGQITGVPTAPGSYSYTLRVRDAQGALRDMPVVHVINPYDPPEISGSPGTVATRGVPYTATFSVSDGLGPFTWTMASGTLPTGITLNPNTGTLSGTPTSTTFVDMILTLRVTDSLGSSGQYRYVLRYRDAMSSTHVYPPGIRGEAYDSLPAASGGHAPFTWALTSGTLPPGLSLNTTSGRISGTPTANASTSINVRCTDAAGNVINLAQTFIVSDSYVPVDITGGMTNTTKNYQRASGTEVISPSSTLNVVGGAGSISYSWARVSGSSKLSAASPASKNTGFNCSAAAGESVSALFRLTATDGTTSDTYDVTITGNNNYAFPTLTGSPAGRSMRTVAYSSGFTRGGGVAPYSFSITSGSLPAGLSINASTGVISGTPTATSGYGARSITVRVTDGLSQSASATYSLDYQNVVGISGTAGPAYTGQAYSFVPTLTPGYAPYTVTLFSGSLPAGLSLNASTGAITGTPSSAGTSNITLRVTDSFGAVANRAISIVVNAYTAPSLSGSYANRATRTKAYSSSITRSGGLAPFTFNLQSGSLPAGMSLNSSTGAITGTPTSTSYVNSTFTVRVTDALGNTATTGTQTIIYRNIPTFSGGGTITRKVRTEAISHQLTVNTTAHTPVTFSIASGSLPAGASLNSSTGAVTGTLTGTSYGTFNVTFRATDAVGNTVDAACTFQYANVVAISAGGVPADGGVGLAYSGTVTSSGGFTPRTYSIVSGSLPSGLSLNSSTGAISGTPSAAYNSSFTVRVTDADGRNIQTGRAVQIYGAFSISSQWSGGTIALGASLSANGATAANGKPSVTYSLLSGSLPSGISLNSSNGNLTGTVGGSGSYSFRIRATDALGRVADTSTISGSILSATANPDSVFGFVNMPGGPPNHLVGGSTALTISGGSGSHTISWEKVSGDAGITALPGGSPPGRTCQFQGTVMAGNYLAADYRAVITDGSAVFIVNMPVTLNYSTGV